MSAEKPQIKQKKSNKSVQHNILKRKETGKCEETVRSAKTRRSDSNKKHDGLFRVDKDYYTRQVQEFEELVEETIPKCHDTQTIEGM